MFEQLDLAIESFENDTKEYEANRLISSMIGMEADEGDAAAPAKDGAFRKFVQGAKEVLKKIIAFFKGIPGFIRDKVLGFLNRAPKEAEVTDAQAQAADNLEAQTEKLEKDQVKGETMFDRLKEAMRKVKAGESIEDLEPVEDGATECYVYAMEGEAALYRSMTSAMEADEAADENAPKKRKNFSGLFAKLGNLGKRASKNAAEVEKVASEVSAEIEKEANSGNVTPEKSKAWSKILRGLSAIGRFFRHPVQHIQAALNSMASWFRQKGDQRAQERYDRANDARGKAMNKMPDDENADVNTPEYQKQKKAYDKAQGKMVDAKRAQNARNEKIDAKLNANVAKADQKLKETYNSGKNADKAQARYNAAVNARKQRDAEKAYFQSSREQKAAKQAEREANKKQKPEPRRAKNSPAADSFLEYLSNTEASFG